MINKSVGKYKSLLESSFLKRVILLKRAIVHSSNDSKDS